MIARGAETARGSLAPRFEGRRVLIFGLGAFGGGGGAARFFAERGARVTVTDLRSREQLADAIDAIADLPIEEWVLGEHRESDFREHEIVVVNPAVPPKNRWLALARESGARLETEIDLFLRYCRSRAIAGITGSNGKSTTSQLAYEFLAAAGHQVHLGGNIGVSLLPIVDEIEPEDRVVLELSSFQLERLDAPPPDVIAITQFSENHIDWHGSLDAYRHAKERVLAPPARRPGIAVLPTHDPLFTQWSEKTSRTVVPFSPDDAIDTPPGLRGRANRANVAAAAAVATALGADDASIATGLQSFRPLPHRQEWVDQVGGITYVNDSKATTPEAACGALEAWGKRVVVLLGGTTKGGSFERLIESVQEHAHSTVVYGAAADPLHRTLVEGGVPEAQVHRVDDFRGAFRAARNIAVEGDTILLSPACASFDEFRNYEDRGECFRRLVSDLRGDGPKPVR